MNSEVTIKPLDTLSILFSTLSYFGFFVPVPDLQNPTKRKLHRIYRITIIVILSTYTLQHIIFALQMIKDVDKLTDCLTVLIVAVYCTVKVIVFNTNSQRFHHLHSLLNDRMFSAMSPHDVDCMQKNKDQIKRIARNTYKTVTAVLIFWSVTPILKKHADNNVFLPAYFPFNTENWSNYLVASTYLTTVLSWIGYGHMSLDILIGGYYSLVQVQLKIIRYHLIHLADEEQSYRHIDSISSGENAKYVGTITCSTYIDLKSGVYQSRLVHLIKRYEKVIWFSNELESILSSAMLVQFVGSTGIVCIVVYKMTGLSFNTAFVYLLLYLCCLLLELYIFCSYGNVVEYESHFINESIYLSDWTSFSPKFRKQLLIAMARWNMPITPKAGGLVTLSLNTFITILRGSYSIYTILKNHR